MTEHIVTDTVDDGPYRIDAEHAPPTPPGFGPGRWVRDPEARGWRWQHPPPPDEPQPPADSERPIVKASWRVPGANSGLVDVTGRMRCEHDRLVTGEGFETVVSIRLGACPVRQWDEPRPKNDVGELILNREQAEYLRDALTAMLERKS